MERQCVHGSVRSTSHCLDLPFLHARYEFAAINKFQSCPQIERFSVPLFGILDENFRKRKFSNRLQFRDAIASRALSPFDATTSLIVSIGAGASSHFENAKLSQELPGTTLSCN